MKAITRSEALRAGELFYLGKPCVTCGGIKRVTRTYECAACEPTTAEQRLARKNKKREVAGALLKSDPRNFNKAVPIFGNPSRILDQNQ